MRRHLPRRLHARAALILLLPVLTFQLLVGGAFLQRYFDDVVAQMSEALARPLADLVARVDAAPSEAEAGAVLAARAGPLGVGAELGARAAPFRAFYDVSGRTVETVLRARVPGVRGIDFGPDQRVARVEVATRHGPLVLAIPRRLLSPAVPHQMLVIMVVAGAILTGVSYVFLKNQLRPVRRLAEAAEAFGRGQSVPYAPGGATEMRAAGHAFLDMRARIERAAQQRTLMLSGVSHDLRTPLTRMRLALSLSDDAEAPALLGDVAEMEAMIDAFLAYARLEATEAPALTDPAALLREVAQGAARAGRAVEVAALPEGPAVPLRRDVLARALGNLAANGARYGTRVRLGLSREAASLTFRVEDDGPGIPEDRREAAMRPFERLDAARNQDRGGGVGLGLAIAADVARLHGGALRLGDSADLGGLLAEIALPLGGGGGAPPQPGRDSEMGLR